MKSVRFAVGVALVTACAAAFPASAVHAADGADGGGNGRGDGEPPGASAAEDRAFVSLLVAAGCEAGRTEWTHVDFGGGSARVRVLAATEDAIVVETKGVRVSIPTKFGAPSDPVPGYPFVFQQSEVP